MDEIRIIMGKLDRAYESIQNLNMPTTKTNMEIVLATMAAMKDAYDFLGTINLLEEKPAEAAADGIDAGTPEEDERVEATADGIDAGTPEEEGAGHV